MVNKFDLAWRVKSELRASLESFARNETGRPGAILLIDVQSPLMPDENLHRRLGEDAADVIRHAGRTWTPSLTFSTTDSVRIEVDFATAVIQGSNVTVPQVTFEFPEDQYSQGVVRSQLEELVVYSLTREPSGTSSPESRQLVLSSRHFPAEPFLQIQRVGEQVVVRAPCDRYRVRVVSQGHESSPQRRSLDLGDDWQPIVTGAATDRASGRFEIVAVAGNASRTPIPLDYNILGWGLQWNQARQTRFPGVTTGEVIVTKREVTIAGRTTPSFIKTYECYTVDDAAVLEQHFRSQQQVIRAINREAGTSAALEEVEVWRGRPLRVTGTVTYYGEIPTTQSAAARTVTPHLQPDHRVFVSRPSLPPADWTGGGTSGPERLVQLARTLDIAHRQGAAHCDVKPENVRVKQQYERHDAAVAKAWTVLIDSEAFTQPNGRVRYTGLHTPSYTHPAFDPEVLAHPRVEELVANDRLGFVAITIAALFGSEVCNQVFAVPQPSPSWRRQVLTDTVAERLPHAAADALIETLMAPLETDSGRLVEAVDSWSCSGWLAQVSAQMSPESASPHTPPAYAPQVKRVMESIATAFNNAARPNKELAIKNEVEREVGRAFWRAFLRGTMLGSAVAAVPAIVLFIALTLGGGS